MIELYLKRVWAFNRVTYWLLWLFVTCVGQLSSNSLKTRNLVTTFAHAHALDRCVLEYVLS